MSKIKLFIVFAILTSLLSFTACTDEIDDMNASQLIDSYGLAGKYQGQVTPSFMGLAPITTGKKEMYFEKQSDGTLKLHFEGFREDPMPFVMTVDITIEVRKGSNNTLILSGKDGTFRADPPDGKPIDPSKVPPGIQLPEGTEGGMISNIASITGTYGEIEKDGEKALRFDLKLTPGLPLPVEILIYTHRKIN